VINANSIDYNMKASVGELGQELKLSVRSGKPEAPISNAGLPTPVGYDHLGLWVVEPSLPSLKRRS
jgi:hypothetical protein